MSTEELLAEAVRLGKLMEQKALPNSQRIWARTVFAAAYERATTPEWKHSARMAWMALRYL